MIEKSVDEFLDALAGREPTPGGGGAAAVMGAMGAALVSMVCRLTLGKKGYEAVEHEMKSTLDRAEELRARLTSMVHSDAEAFECVMTAYRLPKDSDENVQSRHDEIQQALMAATEVPLVCARLCAEVVRLSRLVAERGNRNVVSDAGVAVMGAYAGMKSAALNVYVNTGAIKDAGFVEPRVGEIERLLAEGDVAANDVFQLVRSRM